MQIRAQIFAISYKYFKEMRKNWTKIDFSLCKNVFQAKNGANKRSEKSSSLKSKNGTINECGSMKSVTLIRSSLRRMFFKMIQEMIT